MALNKSNPIPLYYQLAELLQEQIRSGELKPGDQLPSERELSNQAAISRMTVRQAIAYLVRQGILIVRQGVGTFVAEPKLAHDTLHLLGFTEEIMQRGGAATSRVLEQAVVIPPISVATELKLEPQEMALNIVRLRLAGDTPLLLETIFIPVVLCSGLEHQDLATQSLYAVLEQQYGLHLNHARQTLEATTANEYESHLFSVETGTAMILLEGVTYLDQGSPVEYFKAIYRGDRFKFELESQRDVNLHEVSRTPRITVVLE